MIFSLKFNKMEEKKIQKCHPLSKKNYLFVYHLCAHFYKLTWQYFL